MAIQKPLYATVYIKGFFISFMVMFTALFCTWFTFKTNLLMSSITKWLVGRLPTATQGKCLFRFKHIPISINHLYISCHKQWSIIVYFNFSIITHINFLPYSSISTYNIRYICLKTLLYNSGNFYFDIHDYTNSVFPAIIQSLSSHLYHY